MVAPLPWIRSVALLVLDGVGVGALPDASEYGDAGSNTLGNISALAPLRLPNLQRLGLGNILPLRGVPGADLPTGCFGRMAERSAGKDSTIGHWELMGLITPQAFPTYPHGFPRNLVERFEESTGRMALGNVPASGTEIIQRLHDEHRRTGGWILYTSADSVFQVAAHEDVIPTAELYAACESTANWLFAEGIVCRVIARPFTGDRGALRRFGRRDYNTPPPGPTALDALAQAMVPVTTIGKIHSLFDSRGITDTIPAASNAGTLAELVQAFELSKPGFYFANCVDFDMLWGHRNDVQGFADGLAAVDAALPGLLAKLGDRDVLVIAADHGCDPTTASTDHSREYVPLLVTGPRVKSGVDLGARASFADVGATICEALGVEFSAAGRSFWREIAQPATVEETRAHNQRMDWLRRCHLAGRSAH